MVVPQASTGALYCTLVSRTLNKTPYKVTAILAHTMTVDENLKIHVLRIKGKHTGIFESMTYLRQSTTGSSYKPADGCQSCTLLTQYWITGNVD